MSRKIIIDTDPGQDDAVAILLALASPELEVLALTAVAGNVPLALTQRNTRQIVELAGKRTPVHAGCDRPLKRALVTAEYVHGKTGLDGIPLPEPTHPLQDQHAVDCIIDTLRAHAPGTITLCPLGPLTNIATAFSRAPDIIPRVAEIVLMGGGCFEGGNITPAAEFNIYVDPEAAECVFKSGVPLVVMPLDVTHKALTSRDWVEGMRNLGTPVGQAVASWTDFFERFDTAKYGSEGAPLHDPHQRGDRDGIRAHPRHDRRRLVARERKGAERDVHGRRGPGRVLPAVDGAVGEVVRASDRSFLLFQAGKLVFAPHATGLNVRTLDCVV